MIGFLTLQVLLLYLLQLVQALKYESLEENPNDSDVMKESLLPQQQQQQQNFERQESNYSTQDTLGINRRFGFTCDIFNVYRNESLAF